MNTVSEAEIVYNGTNHSYSLPACHAPHTAHALRDVTHKAVLLEEVIFSEFSRTNILFCSIIHVTYNNNNNNNNYSRICSIIHILIIREHKQQKINVFRFLLQT